MEEPRSEHVQHGLQSWVDYSKHGLASRQFLISSYYADILTNSVSVMLTLAAPRLWILVRAFLTRIMQCYKSWKRHRTSATPSSNQQQYGDIPLYEILDHNLSSTSQSHSELSAAMEVLRGLLREAQAGRISLPLRTTPSSSSHSRPWRVILRKFGDSFVSLVVALLLVGMFIAQSTGAVLSARIFGNAMALSNSPGCIRFYTTALGENPGFTNLDLIAGNYYFTCWRRSTRPAPRCEVYANLTIAYSDLPVDRCPFNDGCMAPQFRFDTGWINANFFGLNHNEDYFVRTRNTYTQIEVNRSHAKRIEQWTNQERNNSLYYNDLPLPGIFSSCHSTEVKNTYSDPVNNPDIEMVLFLKCPKAVLDPKFERNMAGEHVAIQLLASKIQYANETNWRLTRGQKHDACHKDLESCPMSFIATLRESQFCDTKGSCWDAPIYSPSVIKRLLHSPSSQSDESKRVLHPLKPDLKNGLARTLLSSMTSVNMVIDWFSIRRYVYSPLNTILDPRSDFGHRVSTHDLISKAREGWECGLARMQVVMVETVRGFPEPMEGLPLEHSGAFRIPPEYRGVCKMVTFRSFGWRNVSVWGLLGLVALATTVSLASIRGSDGQLWLIKALQVMERTAVTLAHLLGEIFVPLFRMAHIRLMNWWQPLAGQCKEKLIWLKSILEVWIENLAQIWRRAAAELRDLIG